MRGAWHEVHGRVPLIWGCAGRGRRLTCHRLVMLTAPTTSPAMIPAPDRQHRLVLGTLCLVDLAFIAAHLGSLALPGLLPPWRFSIEADGTWPEQFQYLKWGLVALLMAIAAVRSRSAGLLPWAVLFGYLLADDALGLHERFGRALAHGLALPRLPFLRPQDSGELLYLCGIGLLLLATLAMAWRRGNANSRTTTLDMVALLILLAFCGVALDLLHVAMPKWLHLKQVLGVLEDGGEMFCASLMTAYATALVRLGRPPACGPWPLPPLPVAWARVRARLPARLGFGAAAMRG